MNIRKLIIATILLFSIFKFNVLSQRLITGTILDYHNNRPVPFANVTIPNSPSGTTSNNNGEFSLKIINNQGELTISHINYEKKIFPLSESDTTTLFIYLKPKISQLQEVVVSATLNEQLVIKTSKPVNIIPYHEITNHFYSNIADMLSRTPGFAQIWEYHSPLLMRGLNSNRLLVMKNGNRRIGTFPGGYFGQDLNIYDSRKIEIIKGPGSVIYGSGAISGIINIQAPSPFGKNKTNVKFISGYGSNNNELLEGMNLCYKKEKFGFNIHGKWRKTDEYSYGNDEMAKNSNVEDKDISLNSGVKISDSQKIILIADYHNGDWGKPRGFNGPEKYFTKIRNKEENIHSSISYEITPPSKTIKHIKLNLYYDNGDRDYYKYKFSTVTGDETSLDLVHYKDNYGGGKLFSTFFLTKNNTLTVGVDGYFFQLDNPSDYYNFYNNTEGSLPGYKNAGQENIGFFTNDEWQISEKTNIVAGIRYDYAKVNQGEYEGEKGLNEKRTALSGNFGMVFSAAPHTNLSLNIGHAFRMPTAEELFIETVSCKGIKKGNPQLDPEYSWNFDLGLRGTSLNNQLKWDLSLFYNIIDNYIGESPLPDDENVDFSYENTNAVLLGGETSVSYRIDKVLGPANALFLGLSMSHVHGIDKSQDEHNAPLFGIPPFTILSDLNYKGKINKHWLTGYFLKMEGQFAAAQNRIGIIPEGTDGGPWGYIESDPHFTLNLIAGLNSNALTGHPKLRLVINNLTDNNYKPFGSYIPAMGRNVKILLSCSF
jgi:outer membrane receptor protein involved in Fe transport